MSGLHLRHHPVGAGRPALALHCMMGSGAIWMAIAGRLGGRVDLSAPDLPGHGRSPVWQPAEGGYFSAVCAGVQPILESLADGSADGRVDLIGHSLGAVAALRLAADAPSRIRSLTLVEPVLFAALPPHQRDPGGLLDRLDQLVSAGAAEDATAAFLRHWDGPDLAALPEPARAAMTRQMAGVMDAMPDLYRDRSAILTPGALEAISAPVMLIEGAETRPVIPAITAALAERLPGAVPRTVAGTGHMAPVTRTAAVADLIAENLDRA